MDSFEVVYYECGSHVINLKPGNYLLEAWGAQGGGFTSESCEGGKGAYAKGVLLLSEITSIFIFIGENGYDVDRKNTCNGGGKSLLQQTNLYKAKSGGGSTDIRVGDINLKHRVIVAAGGGGSAYTEGKCGRGGDAGTLNGFDGQCSGHSLCTTFGGGATQTSGGAGTDNGQRGVFYYGGNITYEGAIGSGGGGGWFGGGAGNLYGSGGGGGSSYVFEGINSEYQLLDKKYRLTNPFLIAGNELMPDPANVNAFEIGHTGNGAVRLTFLREQHGNSRSVKNLIIMLFFFNANI